MNDNTFKRDGDGAIHLDRKAHCQSFRFLGLMSLYASIMLRTDALIREWWP